MKFLSLINLFLLSSLVAASKLKGASNRRGAPILPNGQRYDGRGEYKRSLKAVAKGPPSRECKSSAKYCKCPMKELCGNEGSDNEFFGFLTYWCFNLYFFLNTAESLKGDDLDIKREVKFSCSANGESEVVH